MSLCSGNNATTNVSLFWGQQGDLELTITRAASSTVSLENAQLSFTIGQSYDVEIQTVPPADITLTTNTASQLVATFSVDEGLISNALGTAGDYTLYWQLGIVTASLATATIQDTISIHNAFDGDGAIVTPPTNPTFYLTTNTLDPAEYSDGQYPRWDAANSKFEAVTLTGGGGSLANTDDLAEGATNLYYTDARFNTALGAAIAANFSSSVQASLALADSALQSGDNISVLTNDAGYSTFSGAYADLSGLPTLFDGDYSSLANIPATFAPSAHNQAWSTITSVPTNITQLGGLTADNGKVIGWSGGALANLTISGGGDMLKSVYDSNDDGVIDVGAIPDLSGSYEAAGAVSTHVGLSDPHTQYAETADLGTAAFEASTAFAASSLTLTAGTGLDGGGNLTTNRSFALDAATQASLALADTATQPGGNVSSLVNDAGYSTFDGVYSSLSGIPSTFTPSAHNQAWSTITATPTTLAGYGITDAATSAQGGLADTALQPGDAIPQSNVTGLVSDLAAKLESVAADDITDGTATGQALITATDAATARTAIGSSGGIQLQPTQRATTQIQISHTAAWVDIVSVSITPTVTISVIELSAIVQVFYSAASGGLRLVIDGSPDTVIYDPSPADATGSFLIGFGSSGYAGHLPVYLRFPHSPGSTAPITYKLQGRRYATTGAFLTTTSGASNDGISILEAREIAA
jgi:hypothetical protein